jgi:hypothetical protein
MSLALELGDWLLHTEAADEVIEEQFESATDDLPELLISIIENWNALTISTTPNIASRLIWRIFCSPFWLADGELSAKDWQRVCEAASEITLSIPRIHEPEEPMETGFHMLWDLLSRSGENLVPYLAKLILHVDVRVKFAALHGLGHQSSDRIAVIENHKSELCELFGIKYVTECLKGEVL